MTPSLTAVILAARAMAVFVWSKPFRMLPWHVCYIPVKYGNEYFVISLQLGLQKLLHLSSIPLRERVGVKQAADGFPFRHLVW